MHHIYAEENGRLLVLKLLATPQQESLTQRFQQEFARYMRKPIAPPTAPGDQSAGSPRTAS